MDKHKSPRLPVDSTLPRPVVLSVDDLASVAAAGALLEVPAFGGRIIIAGGLPAASFTVTAATAY